MCTEEKHQACYQKQKVAPEARGGEFPSQSQRPGHTRVKQKTRPTARASRVWVALAHALAPRPVPPARV